MSKDCLSSVHKSSHYVERSFRHRKDVRKEERLFAFLQKTFLGLSYKTLVFFFSTPLIISNLF